MNRQKGLLLSVVILFLTMFSTAHADELSDAWLLYESSRAQLMDSFTLVDNAWMEVGSAWSNLDSIWQQIDDSWNVALNARVEAEGARRFLASTSPPVFLVPETPRLYPWTNPRVTLQSVTRTHWTPWTAESTRGSWEELNQAWASLDAGWAVANNAWAELDRAWAELGTAHGEADQNWMNIDQTFMQVSMEFQEIDAAWASRNN